MTLLSRLINAADFTLTQCGPHFGSLFQATYVVRAATFIQRRGIYPAACAPQHLRCCSRSTAL